jgi:putative two-component system response regulator
MNGSLAGARIMVVDDAAISLRLAKAALTGAEEIYTAPSGERMLELMDSARPDLIILDICMPGMDGFQVIRALKSDPATEEVPVIFVTGSSDTQTQAEGFRLGAVDFITKPFEPEILRARVGTHLTIRRQRKRLVAQSRELERLGRHMRARAAEEAGGALRLQGSLFEAVVDLLKWRGRMEGGIANRTSGFLRILMQGMSDAGIYAEEISPWDLSMVLRSSVLHDVGKISITDTILNKPGRLTEEEFEKMKLHTVKGAAVLARMGQDLPEDAGQFLTHARVFAESHHERWDGSGYPKGLVGGGIPLQGRLMAVCDVYDALVSKRPYKDPFPPGKAEKIIMEGAGTHFDPALVEAFARVREKFREP